MDSLNSSVGELERLSRLMARRIDEAHRRHDYLTDEADRLFSSKLDLSIFLISDTQREIATLESAKRILFIETQRR